jgi:hypothetical protein
VSATIAHFVITGEFITQQARAFWNAEDEPERALNLLKCMHGITDAQCLEILEGRKKLIGDSNTGVDLVDDNANGRSFIQILIKLRNERDEASDERADLIQMINGDTVGVASPTGRREIPHRKSTKKHSMLGRITTVADGHEFDDLATGDNKPFRIWRQSEYIGPSGIDLRDVELDDDTEPTAPKSASPTPEIKITNDTGWLSPEGKFYPCRYAQHAHVAWLLGLTGNQANHGVDPAGWVRLGVIDNRQYFFGEHSMFNAVQNDLIRAYCTEKQIELPYWLKETE